MRLSGGSPPPGYGDLFNCECASQVRLIRFIPRDCNGFPGRGWLCYFLFSSAVAGSKDGVIQAARGPRGQPAWGRSQVEELEGEQWEERDRTLQRWTRECLWLGHPWTRLVFRLWHELWGDLGEVTERRVEGKVAEMLLLPQRRVIAGEWLSVRDDISQPLAPRWGRVTYFGKWNKGVSEVCHFMSFL